MSETASRGRPGRGGRGGAGRSHQGRGSRSGGAAGAPAHNESLSPEDATSRELSSKYSKQLTTIQEIYPTWSAQDLLFTLKDANGDLETAIARISEGQAQQWDSVKSKKSKQIQRQQQHQQQEVSTPITNTQSSLAPRGSTRGGRGDARGGRGGSSARGGRGRGARGAQSATSQPLDPQPNGTTHHDASPAADAVSTTATAGRDTPAAPSGPWGGWGSSPAPPPAQTEPASTGWGDDEPAAQVNGNSNTTEVAAAEEPKPAPTTNPPVKRPAGATLSWAQIAKPQEAPKPSPATVALPTPPIARAPPIPQLETRPTLEEHDDEQVVPEPTKPVNDPWASTPAASVVSSFPNQPLGVGEGWAETVLSNATGDEVASNQQAFHHAAGSPNLANALPPSGVDPAGAIEVSDAANTYEQPTTELSLGKPVAAQLEDQVEAQQREVHSTFAPGQAQAAGPPGFAQKSSKEQGPVAGNVDRIGVQFGSLGLFDQAAPVQQAAEPKAAARSPEVQDRQNYSAVSQAAQVPSASQGIPAGPFGGYPQFAGAPAAQAAQAGFGGFGGQIDQYQLHHQQQLGQLPNGPVAAQRSAEPSPFPGQQVSAAQAASTSPYASLADTQQSTYYQGHAGVPTSAPQQGQQQAQQIPSSYAAFHSVQAQQPQTAQYGQSDYAHLYGLQQRPGAVPSAYGAYSNYSEQAAAQAAQAAYGRQSASGPDDKAQQGPGSAAAPPQNASPMGQQHPGAGYPAGYGYPYYYGGYGSPYSAPGFQQSPYAAYQYNTSAAALQGLANRPGGYQQQQASLNAGYRGSIPAPANYGQQNFYQAYPQQGQQQQGQERDRSSYKNAGFSDF